MTIFETRAWTLRCDECKLEKTMFSQHQPPKLIGWNQNTTTSHDCGSTGYSRVSVKHICPDCLHKT
jgi:rubredoxin